MCDYGDIYMGKSRTNRPGGPDDLDRAILAGMVDDSNVSVKELASRLGIHPNTLFLRLKRLRSSGTIVKSSAVVDYERSGYPTEVLVSIKVRTDKGWERQLRPLACLHGVVSFSLVTGEYDALAALRLRNDRELPALVRRIQENPVVVKTLTQVVLDHWKLPHEFNPFRNPVPVGSNK
jgi:Lrp/AsnC family transcriptional regulator for asnA, asnC and gidA